MEAEYKPEYFEEMKKLTRKFITEYGHIPSTQEALDYYVKYGSPGLVAWKVADLKSYIERGYKLNLYYKGEKL